MLSSAITHYTLKGNFRRAATHQQNLAEVYEVEIGDQKRAVEAYETAAGWFENDNAEAYVPTSSLPSKPSGYVEDQRGRVNRTEWGAWVGGGKGFEAFGGVRC